MNPDLLTELPPDLFPGVIYIYDLKERENFYMNSKFEEILGYSHEEIHTMGPELIATLIHPEDKVRVEKVMAKLGQVKPGETIRTEYRLKDKAGRWRWFADSACISQLDDSGQMKQIVGTAIEITESKEAVSTLENVYNLFQLVLDCVPLSIAWKDHEGAYLGYNRNFLKQVGLETGDNIVGKTDFDLPWKETNAQAYREADKRVMSENKAEIGVLEKHLRKDGQPLILQSTRLPIIDEDGDVVGVLCTQEDVTDNVMLPKTLEALNERYQLLLQSTTEAVLIIDVETKHVLEVNTVAETLTGRERKELLQEDYSVIYPEPQREAYCAWVDACLKAGEEKNAEHVIHHTLGHDVPVDVYLKLLTVEERPLIRINMRDISAYKQMEVDIDASQDPYRVLVDVLPQLVVCFDREGRVAYANDAACHLWGKTAEDITESNLLSFLHREDADSWLQFLAQLTGEGSSIELDLRIANTAGDYLPYCAVLYRTSGESKDLGDYHMAASAAPPSQETEILKKEVAKADQQRASLEAEMDEAKASGAKWKEQAKASASDLEACRKELDAQVEILAKNEQAMLSLRQTLDKQSASEEDWELQCKESEEAREALEQELKALEDNCVTLQEKLEESRQQEAVLKEQLAASTVQPPEAVPSISGDAQARWLKYIQETPLAYIEWDKDYNIVQWNPAAERIFSYTAEEALGQQGIRLVIARKDRLKTKTRLDALKRSGCAESITHQNINKAREPVVCEWYHTPLKNEAGEFSGFAAHVVPAASLPQEQRAAPESGLRFKQMFENHEAIMFIIDPETLCIVDVNKAAEKYYGYSRRAFLRKRVPDISMESEEDIQALFKRSERLRHYHFQTEHRLANREVRHLEIRVTPIISPDNQKLHFAIGNDITERLQFEKKLSESEERWQLALSAAREGVWDWDPQTDTVYYSSRWKAMLGYEEGDIGNRADEFYSRVHSDDLPKLKEAMRGHLEDPDTVIDLEVRMQHKSGDYHWIRIRGKGVYDKDGNLQRLVGANADVTEMKQIHKQLEAAKEAAEAAHKTKSSFLANMSHEIRTPLNAILGFCELLQGTSLQGDQQDYIHRINSSGSMLMDILNNILDLTKMESDKLEIERAYLEPRTFIEEIIILFSKEISDKGLKLEHSFKALPQSIQTDPTRLRQILFNLLSNALKFTEKGKISVRVSIGESLPEEQAMLCIQVTDTGIGISAEDQEKIFKTFTQADSSTTRKYGGTGLGLAISNRLAKLLGGSLEVESQVGKGSTFTLKVLVGISESPSFISARSDSNPFRKMRERRDLSILYVEDNVLNQEVASVIISKMNHTLDIVSNGKEALEKMTHGHFDVVLMDIQMPEMDGLECAQRIRADFPPEEQPYIIAITAAVLSSDRKACLEAGMDDYLTKPLKQEALEVALNQAYTARA